MELIDNDFLEIKKIITKGVVIKPNKGMSEHLYSFRVSGLGKEAIIGIDEKGIWFKAYTYTLYLRDYLKTWWYKGDK